MGCNVIIGVAIAYTRLDRLHYAEFVLIKYHDQGIIIKGTM